MLRKIKRYIVLFDYWMLLFALLISTFGILAIYSAGYDPATGEVESFYQKQLIWLFVGVILFFIVSLINYNALVSAAPFLYIAGLLLLIIVDITGYIGMGAQRWLSLGPIRIQPSELFKSIWIVMLAWIFINFDHQPMSFLQLSKRFAFLIPPFILVFLQPDLGTSLIYVFVWGAVVLILGVRRKTLMLIGLIIIVAMPLAWSNLKEYQKNRVITFMNPERDPFGTGYHVIQSKIGVGSGGINGKGYLKGTQSHLRFIPERHTDFIYSVINEEFGLIGGSVIILFFGLLIYRIVNTALKHKEAAGKIITIAVASNIFLQFMINSFMTVGMMPVVGVPMPFVSYGGSSIMSFFIMLGLVNSVYIRRYKNSDE